MSSITSKTTARQRAAFAPLVTGTAKDHAFPTLRAERSEIPPHFRFMWVQH